MSNLKKLHRRGAEHSRRDDVWHQFVFLLAQYDQARGGRQNFTAFLPSQGVEYPLTIEDAPAQTYTLKVVAWIRKQG